MKGNNFSYIGGPASNFKALGTSHIGNAHVAGLMACQDAYKLGSGTFSEKPWAVFSVADGHGSEEFEYSDVGSANACQAIEMAFELMLMETAGDLDTIKKRFLDTFAEQVQRLWEVLCGYHYKFVLPLANDSFGKASEKDKEAKQRFGSKELSKYGSTLSSVLLYGDHIFIYRIGDSDVVLLEDQNSASHVFVSDENMISSETYSLCSANATEVSQLKILNITACKSIFLATDGLANSYEKEESLFKLIRAIDKKIRNNDLDTQSGVITNYIKNLSIKGCGDDITLVHIAFFAANHSKLEIEENISTGNSEVAFTNDADLSASTASINSDGKNVVSGPKQIYTDTQIITSDINDGENSESEQVKKKVNL